MFNRVLKPRTKDLYVGVEIEFFYDITKGNSLEFFLEKENLQGYVNIGLDHSIRPPANYVGKEIRVLCKEQEVYNILSRVCRALKRVGARVNKSCGLHVHIDVRNRNIGKTFDNLVKSQDVLYSVNYKTRLTGKYSKRNRPGLSLERYFCQCSSCGGTGTTQFNMSCLSCYDGLIYSSFGASRYKGINVRSVSKHKTLEIRISEGTTNSKRISYWVKTLLTIVNGPSLKTEVKTLHSFGKKFNVNNRLLDFLKMRKQEVKKAGYEYY